MLRTRERGFTLVELLVAVAIAALLLAIAVPKVMAASNRSKEAAVERDLKNIHDALEGHYTDLGYYPNKLGDLVKWGYLKRGATFKSPLSRWYYFYAVDNNQPSGRAQAYILGAPTRESTASVHLYHQGPLPQGRHPYNIRALGWAVWGSTGGTTGHGLYLYEDDDSTRLPDSMTPATLETYRFSCRPGSTTRCDLRTN